MPAPAWSETKCRTSGEAICSNYECVGILLTVLNGHIELDFDRAFYISFIQIKRAQRTPWVLLNLFLPFLLFL